MTNTVKHKTFKIGDVGIIFYLNKSHINVVTVFMKHKQSLKVYTILLVQYKVCIHIVPDDIRPG